MIFNNFKCVKILYKIENDTVFFVVGKLQAASYKLQVTSYKLQV